MDLRPPESAVWRSATDSSTLLHVKAIGSCCYWCLAGMDEVPFLLNGSQHPRSRAWLQCASACNKCKNKLSMSINKLEISWLLFFFFFLLIFNSIEYSWPVRVICFSFLFYTLQYHNDCYIKIFFRHKIFLWNSRVSF